MNTTDAPKRYGPHDAVYAGQRRDGRTPQVIADGEELSPVESQSIRNHSPDGFEWGYCGSGPAQLALALLLHATRGNRECAEELYQRYKADVVSRWAKEWWVTTRAAILRWIGEQPGHLGGAESAAEGGEP